jgi:hypothetical protein
MSRILSLIRTFLLKNARKESNHNKSFNADDPPQRENCSKGVNLKNLSRVTVLVAVKKDNCLRKLIKHFERTERKIFVKAILLKLDLNSIFLDVFDVLFLDINWLFAFDKQLLRDFAKTLKGIKRRPFLVGVVESVSSTTKSLCEYISCDFILIRPITYEDIFTIFSIKTFRKQINQFFFD